MHQESEIPEEVFTAEIEKVEKARLEVLVKTRSLLRDEPEVADTEAQEFISREDIQQLHHQLVTLPDLDDPVATPLNMNCDPSVHDYINQEVVDMVLNEEGNWLCNCGHY